MGAAEASPSAKILPVCLQVANISHRAPGSAGVYDTASEPRTPFFLGKMPQGRPFPSQFQNPHPPLPQPPRLGGLPEAGGGQGAGCAGWCGR